MSRIIRINDCSDCPSKDHLGAYAKISYIPVCRYANKELPYTCSTDHTIAIASNVIPEWCPLEKLVDYSEGV